MNLSLLSLLLFPFLFCRLFSASAASNLKSSQNDPSNFSFSKVAAKIASQLIKPKRVVESLNRFNKEGLVLRRSNAAYPQEYLMAQQTISASLLKIEELDFVRGKPVETFSFLLLDSLEENIELFTDEYISEVFGVLFAAGNVLNISRIRKLLVQRFPDMSHDSKIKIYNYLIEFMNVKMTFIFPELLNGSFESVPENFIDTYIAKFMRKFEDDGQNYSENFACMSILLLAISSSAVKISDSSYIAVLVGLKLSMSSFYPSLLNEILGCLCSIVSMTRKRMKVFEAIMDLLFLDQIAGAVDCNIRNPHFIGLLNYFKKVHEVYYTSSLNNASDLVKENIRKHSKYLKKYEIASDCGNILQSIHLNSSEIEYKRAAGASKNLFTIYKDFPDAVLGLSNIFQIADDIIKKFVSYFFDKTHPLNALTSQIIGYISLFFFNNSIDNSRIHASSNISYCIGNLVEKSKTDPSFYPSELIQEVVPNFEAHVKDIIKSYKSIPNQMLTFCLESFIAFVRVVSNSQFATSAIDELCLNFIKSTSISLISFEKVSHLCVDEYLVTRAGFFFHLKNFLDKPNLEVIPHFGDLCIYLNGKKFLSKTEIMLLNKIFNFYAYLYCISSIK